MEKNAGNTHTNMRVKKEKKEKTKHGGCWLYFLAVSTWCHCAVLKVLKVVNSVPVVLLPAIVQLVFCFSLRTYSMSLKAALCIFPILKFQIIFMFFFLNRTPATDTALLAGLV